MEKLANFFAVLLGFALAATAVVWVLNTTIWNATYLQTKFDTLNVADSVAKVLPDIAVQYLGNPDETRSAVQSAVTPEFISSTVHDMLPVVLTYLRQGGEPPVLDLREIGQRVEAAGLPMPQQLADFTATPQPITFGGVDQQVLSVANWGTKLTWIMPLVVIALAVLIFLTAGHKRWLTLAIGTISGSAITLVAALLSYAPQPLVSSALNTSALKLLSPLSKEITSAIAQDQIQLYLTWAKGYAILAAILFALYFIMKLFGGHRSRKHPKADSSQGGMPSLPNFN